MSAIYLLVHRVLEMGYLSKEHEGQLRNLVGQGCNGDDLEAVVMLKQALVFGHVKRQAHRSK
ncbi:MAG: hypothetical protein B0A82_09845 [Alkalinema sp. CACIAM 70d]|uniref:hypothetical protein n=1 Tax=Alkalinema pantanalense TaxID=1620705 RepID=UPI000B723C42|nr:MAG: hypothetical protein B0A82_09845 [Alkalinema sp. CACIAM 70d]